MAMHLNAIFFFAVTVLKRKILLSISGCLVVGIVLIVLGCIILKVTRKPGQYVLPVFMYLCLCLAISRKKGFHSYLNVQ